MNKLALVFVVAIVVGGGASAATSHPLSNVVVDDNSDGWFTTANLEAYGDDLDARIDGERGYIFTGHPAYVMESEKARMLFDMPRTHYFAISWNDSEPGDRLYANLTRAIHTGTAQWAINNTMTDTMMEQNRTLRRAYEQHYCRVDDAETQRLYNRTDSTLLRWVNDSSTCRSDLQP